MNDFDTGNNHFKRNIALLSRLRSSTDLGIVPLRFDRRMTGKQAASGVILLDIHDYSSAGLLVLTANNRFPNPYPSLFSLAQLLIALGYEPHVFVTESKSWRLYDEESLATALDYSEDMDVFKHIDVSKDSISKSFGFPGLDAGLLQDIANASQEHGNMMSEEINSRPAYTSEL